MKMDSKEFYQLLVERGIIDPGPYLKIVVTLELNEAVVVETKEFAVDGQGCKQAWMGGDQGGVSAGTKIGDDECGSVIEAPGAGKFS